MSLHDHMLRQFRSLLLSSGLLLGVLLASGQAQVTTTIRPDNTLGTAVTPRGSVYAITGGTRPGNGPNLFHSFDRFSVGTNDTAHFSGPTGIVNILSRVTGGQQSVIDGRLQSTIPGANLYLLNPSGVLFGPNALLDVSGSFHVSTADVLRFADGATFSAHLGERSTLTTAPPAAFGFLGPTPASITVQGSSLGVSEGKALSVVGGEIQIVGGQLVAPSGRVQLASVASPGEVLASPPEMAPDLQANAFARLGQVTLSQNALLDASGNRGGTVLIRGGRLTIDNATIASITGDRDGAKMGIGLRLAEDVVVDNSAILAVSTGHGNAGEIRAEAGTLTLRRGAVINSLALGSGKGGDITVSARESVSISGHNDQGRPSALATFATAEPGRLSLSAPSVTIDGGVVGTPSLATGGFVGGRGGDIVVQADTLTLSGGGGISSGTATDSDGGSITIETGRLTVSGGAQISASSGFRDPETGTIVAGRGAAGKVTVAVSESVSLSGRGSGLSSNAQSGSSHASDIEGRVGRLTISDGAQISSSTFGSGQGGEVIVTAQEAIMIAGGGISSQTSGSGDAGRVSISAPTVAINGGGLSATTSGAGRAGDILVEAGQLTIARGAQINSSSTAAGAAGTIQITSTTMDMRGDSFIKSETVDGPGGTIKITADTLSMTETTDFHQVGSPAIQVTTQGRGNAGDIVIEGRQVALTGNTILIDSSTSGSGRGGTVMIHATDSITLAGRRDMESSGSFGAEGFGNIVSEAGRAEHQGDAGLVSIVTPVLIMTGGILISTRTIGDSNAGDIEITVGRLTLTGGSQISSSSGEIIRVPPDLALLFGGTGKGGTVKVTATDAIFITGRDPTSIAISGISSETRGPGQAGRVVVSTPQLVMADGGQITAETEGAGRGGDVVVQVGHLSLAGGAQIRSGSARGETLFNIMTGEPLPGQGTGPGGTVTVTATGMVSIAGRSSTGGGGNLFSNDASSGLFSTTQGSGTAGEIVVYAPTLTMRDGGKISVRTTGAGRAGDITVKSGNLTLTGGALIDSSTDGAGRGGAVTVTAREALRITGHGSGLFASTSAQGQGGDITLQAHQLQLSDGAAIAADSTGAGNAGSITITASDVVQNTQSTVTTNTQGSGDAGLVSITAPTLEVTDGRISAVTSGTGNAGNVVVNVGRLILSGQAQIDSSSIGAGQGGSVTATAIDAIVLSGPGGLLSNAAGSGAAGTVLVMAPALRMDNAATIEARTTGDGRAGNVEVQVGQLTLLGGAHISSTSGTVDATGTVIASVGRGGMVTVTATDTSAIAGRDSTGAVASGVFSQTFGGGEAGRVTVSTPQLTLADGGRIGTDTGGDGRGGAVVVQVNNASLTGSAQINSGSGITVGSQLFVGAGGGGTVAVTATDAVTITGQDSGLSTSTSGAGRGGDVTLQAQVLTLTDGARLAAESTGLGNAGNVAIITQAPFLLTNGSVVTRATQADGGNIQITTPTMLRLRDSTITAEVGGGVSTVGGNITIDPQFVLLQNSQIIANAFAGQGGNIRIQAQQVFLADPASQVSASSALGINGQVDIRAPVTNISGTVAPLPQSFAPVVELLRSRCAERLREGTVSRFVVGGRDGVPLEPGGLLPSPLEQAGQGGGVEVGEQESKNTEAKQGQAWYVQAQAPGGLDVECARWIGKQSTTLTHKRSR